MPTIIEGPRCNRRVSCSTTPLQDRSESAIVINPQDPYHMVGASKKFVDPHTYAFSLVAYYSFDGGQSWHEASPLGLLYDWTGVSDPALAFDSQGNVFLLGLPFGNNGPYDLRGMVAYKSTDGGRTWSAPNHIHNVQGDDKQWIVGDVNPASPHYGNVYACWDSFGIGTSQLRFAKTSDHGATWVSIKSGGTNQPAGTAIPGISDSGSPEINVAKDGTIYIVWWNGSSKIRFTKSTDGGDTFSAPQDVATGITPIPGHFPGAKFRLGSWPTACCGAGSSVIVAWADYREGVARIYYRRSNNAGNTWVGSSSGTPMLTGGTASGAAMHDFHPQLASMPGGEFGCAFYEYGPYGGGEFPPNLISVYLAVSTDNGATFPNRALVTDQAWDPTVDEVWAHGDPNITFIGEYFGLDASVLGFYPFWTDTRTGVQEIFVSRLALRPADVFIRDSSSDVGNAPSPGDHWEYVDLVVRRQPDGAATFVNEDLLRDGITDHYVYARVTNRGPNTARNVMLKVALGNWPALDGLPGSEFRYPYDWYQGDWDTPAQQSVHLYLGTSAPVNISNGNTQIIGPVVWPAASIPDPTTFHHPCLLAAILADNNDAAGGPSSIPVPAEGDKNACNFSSFFWGSNDITQRNLSYAKVPLGAAYPLSFSFIAANLASPAKYIDLMVDKGRMLANVPMTLRLEPLWLEKSPEAGGRERCCEGIVEVTSETTLIIKCGDCEIGAVLAKPGTQWRCKDEQRRDQVGEVAGFNARGGGYLWHLDKSVSVIGFARAKGALYKGTLTFVVPPTLPLDGRPLIRIIQHNDKRVVAGGVSLELVVTRAARGGRAASATRRSRKKGRAARGRGRARGR